MFDIYVVSNNR